MDKIKTIHDVLFRIAGCIVSFFCMFIFKTSHISILM